MASNLNSPQKQFTQAATDWELERLYKDLASAKRLAALHKRKGLTEVEKLHLCGLLCGYSPAEIAKKLVKSARGVETDLCSTVYRYVEKLTNRSANTVKNWRDIPEWLEAAGYKTRSSNSVEREEAIAKPYRESGEASHNMEASSIRECLSRAIYQLGNEDIQVRIGAIYDLERIVEDSPRDHWRIMECLADFVRVKASRKEQKERSRSIPDEDIQKALTVMGRRDSKKDPPNHKLDLSNTNLEGADLREANLQGAFLRKANLQRANLIEANLQGADLWGANLQGAKIIAAKLQEAELGQANLEGAFIHMAHLEKAKLRDAILRWSKLLDAKLEEAVLTDVDLQCADLRKANLKAAKLTGAKLRGANLSQANLRNADLMGANLKITNFFEANIESQQIESAYGDSTTVLPDNVKAPPHWMQAG